MKKTQESLQSLSSSLVSQAQNNDSSSVKEFSNATSNWLSVIIDASNVVLKGVETFYEYIFAYREKVSEKDEKSKLVAIISDISD